MVIDTGKLSDLKMEIEQLCMDLDYLIQDSSDELKAKEVANSLDELIEQAGECVIMLTGEDMEQTNDLREAAGLERIEEPETVAEEEAETMEE